MTRYAIKPIELSRELTGTTEQFCVDDLRAGERYIIVIQRVDFRQVRTSIENGIARFTQREHAPSESGDIRLCTPKFYRKLEDGDEMDGTQEADLAPYIATHLREKGIWASKRDFTARSSIASSEEPWILCTSIKPSSPVRATSLENQFSYKGSDAMVTTVNDIDAFAIQLGIDMAQSAELKRATKDGMFDLFRRHCFWLACGADKEINSIVSVIHGPVHYDNETLTVRTGGDFARAGSHRIWFTKRTEFAGEREYRFAVSAGCPTRDTIRLSMSPELLRLTKSWRYGDRWWLS